MNWADFAILGVVLVSALISLMRGFVKESLSLVGWIVAFWISLTFAGGFAELFASSIDDPTLRLIVAFIILFVLTLLLSVMVNFFAVKLVRRTGLTEADRAIGVVFGVLRGTVIVAVLVLLAGLTTLPAQPWWSDSALLYQFQALAMWLKDFLPLSNLDFSLF